MVRMKARTSEEYWLERSKQQEQHAEDITTEWLERMYGQLDTFKAKAIREIETLYSRYADDHKMSKSDARRYLTDNERAEFQNMTLARYTALAKNPNTEPRLIDALAYRHRIQRQEAILAEIEMQAIELYGGRGGIIENTYKNLGQVYGMAKIETAKSYADIGYSFRKPVLGLNTMKPRLKTNWSGDNLSRNIWGHEENLYDTIANVLDQGFIGQWPQEKIVKKIGERVDVAKSNIERLVRTEQTAFNSLGAKEQLEAHLEDDYKIVAVLDSRTTAKCRGEHDNVYPLIEYQMGKNAPPFHFRCRSSIMSTRDATNINYFEPDENYDGPELEEVYAEWEEELGNTISSLLIEDIDDF